MTETASGYITDDAARHVSTIFAYQNKITSQTTMTHLQFVTILLLISAKQTNC